jgi:hypothetical protein
MLDVNPFTCRDEKSNYVSTDIHMICPPLAGSSSRAKSVSQRSITLTHSKACFAWRPLANKFAETALGSK